MAGILVPDPFCILKKLYVGLKEVVSTLVLILVDLDLDIQ